MKYITRFVLNTAFQVKWKIAVIIACLSLGMVIERIFICQVNHEVSSYNTYKKYMNFENIIVIEIFN